MEKGLVRTLELINYRIFIDYKSACSGFSLKHYDFPSTPPVGAVFFCVCAVYTWGLRKKLIATVLPAAEILRCRVEVRGLRVLFL